MKETTTLAPESLEPKEPQVEPPERSGSPPRTGARSNSAVTEFLRIGVSVAILACGVLGMLAFGTGRNPAKSEPKKTTATKVETIEVIAHSGGLDLNVDGIAVPFREIQLAAEVAGRVTFKSEECRAGNFVKAGTPLLRIDREAYELESARLQRQRTEAEQNIKELEVEIANTKEMLSLADDDLDLRKKNVARQKRLSSSKVGTTAALEDAQSSQIQSLNSKKGYENQQRLLTTRKARLQTGIALVDIQLRKAKLDLDRTEITAPVSGVIVSEMAEADSFVQRGTSLLNLEDTSRVEVRCNLTMEELYRLWQADPSGKDPSPDAASLTYQIPNVPVSVLYKLAGRTFAWEGRLARYDGLGLDQKTRTVPCRVVVDEPGNVQELRNGDSMVAAKGGPRALVRGMFVEVRIHTEPKSPLVRIPEIAVRPGNRVWLLRDGQLAVQKAVVAGVSGDDLLVDAEASGIAAGDRAVVSPLAEAIDGMAVEEAEQE